MENKIAIFESRIEQLESERAELINAIRQIEFALCHNCPDNIKSKCKDYCGCFSLQQAMIKIKEIEA